MIIETNLNVGDVVFYMNDSKVQKGDIIEIHINVCSYTKVTYLVKDRYKETIHGKIEAELFLNIVQLMKSLKDEFNKMESVPA